MQGTVKSILFTNKKITIDMQKMMKCKYYQTTLRVKNWWERELIQR